MTRRPDHPADHRGRTVLVAHPGAELYGSDRMLIESVAGLLAAGTRVVVALPGPGPLVDALEDLGAEVVLLRFPVLRKEALRPRGALRLAGTTLAASGPALRLLRRTRPDALYVSTLTVPAWLALGRLAGVRTVCHVHEAERHPRRVVTLGLVLPLRLADRLVLNSRFSASILTDAVPALAGRITVVPNGVVGPPSPVRPRENLDGRLRVLYMGRLSPRKGTDVVLRAVGHRADTARLEVLGSVFPGYEWFEEQLRRDGAGMLRDGSLTITPFVTDIWSHVADADVVVVPSTAPEPFGNTAVEALLAARPVVVSDIGGLPEAVAGSGAALRVPPDDADALGAALEEVRERWTELGRAAWAEREDVADRFSADRYRRRVAELCLEVTGTEG